MQSPRLRTRILVLAIWLTAIALGIWGWVQGAQALAQNLPPLRLLQIAPLETLPDSAQARLNCNYGTAFIQGETVWRYPCFLDGARGSNDERLFVLAQMRPTEGVIAVRAVTPILPTVEFPQPIYAFAHHPDRDEFFLHVLTYVVPSEDGELASAFVRTHTDGTSTLLPIPSDQDIETQGAAWFGDTLEMIALPAAEEAPEREPAAVRYTLNPDDTWQAQPITLPTLCTQPEANCRLQLAYAEAGAWRLLYLNLPQTVRHLPSGAAGEAPWLELPRSAAMLADVNGETLPLALPGNRIDGSDPDTIIAALGMFDRSPANRSNAEGAAFVFGWIAMPYVLTEQSWQPLPAPPAPLRGAASGDLYISYTAITQHLPDDTPDQESSWQLEFTESSRRVGYRNQLLTWAGGRWLLFRDADGELLAEQADSPMFPLDADLQLLDRNEVQGFTTSGIINWHILVPTSEGGYWVLNWIGNDYLRLNADLQRADAPNWVERIGWAIANARSTVREWIWPALLGIVVFYGLPLLIVTFAVLLITRRRHALTWRWTWLPVLYLAVLLLGGEMFGTFLQNV